VTAQATAPAPLHLVLGEEELLIERAVREALTASRAIDATAELTRVRVSDLTAPELAELVSPSLFSEGRVIVLESAQDISQELADAVTSYLKDPADGIVLVVVHTGGGRSKAGKTLPAVLKKAGAEITECPKLTKPAEREQFIRHEVRRVGGKIDAAGVAALLEAVGSDLRELSSAATQLVADAGGTVDADAVHRYHRGRADVTGFAVAEKAVSGDRSAALESLRWAMQLGVPHVLVARVSGAGRGNPNQLAGELGMPPWKIRKAQGQVRGWNQDGLATAMRVVARLNAEVKGVAADPGYALERAVLQVAAAKGDR
jgi:DNA polymerase-3 subunit delta